MISIEREYYGNGHISKEYFWDSINRRHREDGPAYTEYYPNGNKEYEAYYQNDLLHREDGPAQICYKYNGKIEKEYYWIKGTKITDELQIMVIKGLEKC